MDVTTPGRSTKAGDSATAEEAEFSAALAQVYVGCTSIVSVCAKSTSNTRAYKREMDRVLFPILKTG